MLENHSVVDAMIRGGIGGAFISIALLIARKLTPFAKRVKQKTDGTSLDKTLPWWGLPLFLLGLIGAAYLAVKLWAPK